jgi:hypothetical protein
VKIYKCCLDTTINSAAKSHVPLTSVLTPCTNTVLWNRIVGMHSRMLAEDGNQLPR